MLAHVRYLKPSGVLFWRTMIVRGAVGIGIADETLADRDERGVCGRPADRDERGVL